MSAGSLQFFDTYERRIRPFEPIKAGHVGLYTCGPTVYNYAHIGNLRTYLFEDFLRRVLIANGYNVEHVMNITDVGHLTSDADSGDDKMELGAKKAGMSAWDLASFYTEAFQADLAALNILLPSIWCKATDHIPEQIAFVQDLETKGYTYETADGIYPVLGSWDPRPLFGGLELRVYAPLCDSGNQRGQLPASRRLHLPFSFGPAAADREGDPSCDGLVATYSVWQ